MAARWGWLAAAGVGIAIVGLIPIHRAEVPLSFAPPIETENSREPAVDKAFRDDALRRAKVWRRADPSKANLGANPADPTGSLSQPIVRCRFIPHESDGTTPKFRCALPDGEV